MEILDSECEFCGIRGSPYCGYPSGMYRRQSEAEVYLLTGSQYCWVRDGAQVNRLGGWDAVFVMDKPAEKSRFQDGRAYTGLCPF